MATTDRAKMQAFLVEQGKPATGTTAAISDRATQFGYNATEDKGRRQAPQKRTQAEEMVLTRPKRAKLQGTTQDQARNHSLLAWMIRTHLDYVSSFQFSIFTGDDELDLLVRQLFAWHGRPQNFDIAERLGREESFRLVEREKVVSGDGGLIKINDGLKLQGLESALIDKVADPDASKELKEELKTVRPSGLIIDDATQKREKFSVCRYENRKKVFDHLEPAENVIFGAYWTRLKSQERGVSPLSTALNSVQDLFEANEWNLLKAKLHAVFGVALMRKSGGEGGDVGGAGGATDETEDAASTSSGASFDLTPGKPLVVDLDEEADLKIIESATPSTEFINGQTLFIQLAMLAIDMPMTFFDSRKSSFSAMLADLNKYEKSARSKQRDNRYMRQDYSDWLIEEVWNDSADPWGIRKAAEGLNISLRQLQMLVEWVPEASPWLDKLKQVKGDRMAIESGLDNSIDACRRRGVDPFDSLRKQKLYMDKAAEMGVPVVFGSGGMRSIEEIVADEVDAAIENQQAEEGGNDED